MADFTRKELQQIIAVAKPVNLRGADLSVLFLSYTITLLIIKEMTSEN
jgi:hypothetical protein